MAPSSGKAEPRSGSKSPGGGEGRCVAEVIFRFLQGLFPAAKRLFIFIYPEQQVLAVFVSSLPVLWIHTGTQLRGKKHSGIYTGCSVDIKKTLTRLLDRNCLLCSVSISTFISFLFFFIFFCETGQQRLFFASMVSKLILFICVWRAAWVSDNVQLALLVFEVAVAGLVSALPCIFSLACLQSCIRGGSFNL
jgi:hypothetical protein